MLLTLLITQTCDADKPIFIRALSNHILNLITRGNYENTL